MSRCQLERVNKVIVPLYCPWWSNIEEIVEQLLPSLFLPYLLVWFIWSSWTQTHLSIFEVAEIFSCFSIPSSKFSGQFSRLLLYTDILFGAILKSLRCVYLCAHHNSKCVYISEQNFFRVKAFLRCIFKYITWNIPINVLAFESLLFLFN